MPKRPWYVTLALIGTFLLAIGAGVESCERVRHYQGGEAKIEASDIRDEAMRTRVRQRGEDVLESLYAHRKTSYPLHVALFLVSAAMATFSMRVLVSKSFGRTLLVQLVGVQAALMVARHFVERETREAEFEYARARTEATYVIAGRNTRDVDLGVKLIRAATPIYLGFRTFVSLLIIAALLERKARIALDVTGADESRSEV